MSNYFVFRINYDSMFGEIRKELVNRHLLRQGWGADGMDLKYDLDSFKSAWIKRWGENDTNIENIEKRYSNLKVL